MGIIFRRRRALEAQNRVERWEAASTGEPEGGPTEFAQLCSCANSVNDVLETFGLMVTDVLLPVQFRCGVIFKN